MGTLRKLGRKIDDYILQPIKNNPVGAIVSVGAMAMGLPPVAAGALGGAAGAASTGGDILKGAVTGGVMGYAGGAASSAAAGAGAGTVLSSAAGGAAAGAAGAALTGQDLLKGAVTGGLTGGLSGAASTYLIGKTGELAPVEDMSTYSPSAIAEQNAKGFDVSMYNADTGGRTIYRADGGLSTVSPDGQIWTSHPDGSVTIQYADGSVYNQAAGTGAGTWDMSKQGTTPTYTPSGSAGMVGGNLAANTLQDGTVITPTPTPGPTVFPVITTGQNNQVPVGDGSYGVGFKKAGIQQGVGLNPGWIEPTPFYNTTDPVQSQYSWSGHGFQEGPAFNAQKYNQAAAPVTPWGIQHIDEPLTPQEMVAASRGQYTPPQTVEQPAIRAQAYHQYAGPQAGQITGQIYLMPVDGTNPLTTPAPVAPVAG